MVKNIIGDLEFIKSLKGKKATFMLSLSNTKTANIARITQAGIPGKIYLTPTLDSEFLATGEVRSLDNIAETPKGVPTPALLTRAVHLLNPFSSLEFLNLGLEVTPKIDGFRIHELAIKPSGSIDIDAKIDAKELFEKGVDFGKNYSSENEYIILAESVPSGTTTATATALALGYDCKSKFSSSFKDVPNSIREDTIKKALENIKEGDDIFEILGKVSDNMLIFNAGFLLGLNSKKRVLLAGGTQMACVLLVLNSILKTKKISFDSSSICLCTTKWVFEDKNSDIKGLLEILDFKIDAYYSDFDFSLSSHPALKLYDEGEAKEGVGAGGALVYALLNGLSKSDITKKVESFLA